MILQYFPPLFFRQIAANSNYKFLATTFLDYFARTLTVYI